MHKTTKTTIQKQQPTTPEKMLLIIKIEQNQKILNLNSDQSWKELKTNVLYEIYLICILFINVRMQILIQNVLYSVILRKERKKLKTLKFP